MKGKSKGKASGGKGGPAKSGTKPTSALAQLAQRQRALLLRTGGGKDKAKTTSPAKPSVAGAGSTISTSSNPFDKFANARKKHEVVNRRVKGEDRNVGRARDKAVEDRKKRLLQDYQSSKKSNSFQDKRFGEQDATMSLEEKMFVRFQKERLKKARNSSLFNLDSSDGAGLDEQLTHKGRVLGDGNHRDDEDFDDDDDDDDNLGRDVVNQLHFGGGLVPKAAALNDGAQQDQQQDQHSSRNNRLDALQEIVMKSKLHKMERKEAKEEQESERAELDKAFEELVADSVVQFRPTKRDRSEDFGSGSAAQQPDSFADYDKTLRAMAFEAKAKASDRTKTPEELALEEKRRLEDAEAARKQRMRGVIEAEGGAEAELALQQSSAAAGKRGRGQGDKSKGKGKGKKRRTDDDLDGDQPGDIVTDNYGWDSVDKEEEEEEEEEDDEDDEEEDDEDEDEDEDEEEGEGDGEEDSVHPSDEDEEDDEEEKEKANSRNARDRRRPASAASAVAAAAAAGINEQMPHTLPCPSNLEELDELLVQYARSATDVHTLLHRIAAYHSVHLPAPEGPRNRHLMAGFLDLVLKMFVRVGDSLSGQEPLLDGVEAASGAETMATLDQLAGLVFRLCKDLPDAAPVVWGKTLRGLQQLLQNRLRDFAHGKRAGSCWPSLGRLLLLRLVGEVFSVTDFRHSVVAPASMLLCQCLTQCPVASASDAASGILSAAVLLGYTAETKRLVPEALSFLHSVVRLFAPNAAAAAAGGSSGTPVSILGTFDRPKLAALREAAAASLDFVAAADSPPPRIPWRYFGSKQGGVGRGFTPELARSLLCSALNLGTSVVQRHSSQTALPEVLLPLIEALQSVSPASEPALPACCAEPLAELLAAAMRGSTEQRDSRRPLQWRNKETQSLETKAPKFQLDYSFKKDLDPDADRAKMKQLKRQLKREQKAAMRELRRDGEFLDRERFREKTEAAEERRNERAKNFAFMEEQQAHINEQVRKGGALIRGGGAGIVPKQIRSKAAKRRK